MLLRRQRSLQLVAALLWPSQCAPAAGLQQQQQWQEPPTPSNSSSSSSPPPPPSTLLLQCWRGFRSGVVDVREQRAAPVAIGRGRQPYFNPDDGPEGEFERAAS
jgi:hypothetical protein